jgi:hypothetical protein
MIHGDNSCRKYGFPISLCNAIANYPRTREIVQKLPIPGLFLAKACGLAPQKREKSRVVAHPATFAWGVCKHRGNWKAGRANFGGIRRPNIRLRDAKPDIGD